MTYTSLLSTIGVFWANAFSEQYCIGMSCIHDEAKDAYIRMLETVHLRSYVNGGGECAE